MHLVVKNKNLYQNQLNVCQILFFIRGKTSVQVRSTCMFLMNQDGCEFIKGWMHVHIRTFNSRIRNKKPRKVERSTLTIAHVNYISTNQNKTKVPPGVGREMIAYMEAHMARENCHFIELMPLPDVVGFM